MWEQQVHTIIMLTVGMENGQVSTPQFLEWTPGGVPGFSLQDWPGAGGWVRLEMDGGPQAFQDGAGRGNRDLGRQRPRPLLSLLVSTLSRPSPGGKGVWRQMGVRRAPGWEAERGHPCLKHAQACSMRGPGAGPLSPRIGQ